MPRSGGERRWALLLAGLAAAACSHRGAPAGTPDAGPGVDGAAGAAPAVDAGDAAPPDAPVDAPTEERPAGPSDPGRVLLRRLNRREYENTVKDLLGLTSATGLSFADDAADGTVPPDATLAFDNRTENLHMSPQRYLQYFNAAKVLAARVWADPKLKGRIVTCAPDAAGACARGVISTFGLRAWRRPLTDAEVTSLAALAAAAATETGDFQAAMERVVTVMLSSLPFLYKVETDPAPDTTAPHALTGYELASRLSYLLWSTMPDDTLLQLGDGLRGDAVLRAQLDRMLDDPRSDAFVESFAGQWLGARELAAHTVTPNAYPAWDATLQQSMLQELSLFFVGLLDRSFSGFLTEDRHFVDQRLGVHYAIPSPGVEAGAGFVPVILPAGHTGFLGLAGFLTNTSLSYRTSPSHRGAWIRTHLLCAPPPGHVGINPVLNLGSDATSPRKALQQSFVGGTCSGCHAMFDGVGFALEHFDGLGRFRANYSPDEPIDATGTLPDGTKVDGASELAAALARDPALASCAVRQTLSYALGRGLDAVDDPHVAQLAAAWQQGTFRDLVRAIVLGDSFRMRRGETP